MEPAAKVTQQGKTWVVTLKGEVVGRWRQRRFAIAEANSFHSADLTCPRCGTVSEVIFQAYAEILATREDPGEPAQLVVYPPDHVTPTGVRCDADGDAWDDVVINHFNSQEDNSNG